MWKTILDTIFPIHCLNCRQEGDFICYNCFKKIPLNSKQPFKFIITATYYEHPLVKQAIHRYKYDFIKDLAKPLSQLMIQKLTHLSDFFNQENTILVPIPLHKKRLKWRGFDQAKELVLIIGQELNLPVDNNLLIRIKHTLPQVKIKNSQIRKENIKHAFSLKPKEVCLSNDFSNKTIILIDDVYTTGATLNECARILKPLKPKQIWGLVLARG